MRNTTFQQLKGHSSYFFSGMGSSDKGPEPPPYSSVPSDTQQRKQEVFDCSVNYGMFPASHMILLAQLIPV